MSSLPPHSLHALLDETEWVRALARRLVASSHDAEDLAQETMASALFSPPTDDRSLRGWLGTVLANRLRARHRRPNPELEAVRDAAHRFEPSVLETVERAEAHQTVVDAVMSLPEPFRATVLLRYFEGYGPSEIAEREGIPLATVTSRLTRAHARLRDHLQESDSFPSTGLACLIPLTAPGRTARVASLSALSPASLLIVMNSSAKLTSAVALVALAAILSSSYGVWDKEPAVERSVTPSKAQLTQVLTPETLAPGKVVDVNRVGLDDEGAASDAGLDPQMQEEVPPTSAPSRTVLTGIVKRHDGTPASGATVVVGGFGALQFLEDSRSSGKGITQAIAGKDGTFTLNEVPETRILVTAGGAGCAPSESVIWAPSDPTELHLTLREGVRIYGYVHRSDGTLARNRKVRLMQDHGTQDPHGKKLIRYVTTDGEGLYDERSLCPGAWGIVTYPDDEELKELGGTTIGQMVQATVKLKNGEEKEVPLGGLSANAIHVTGRVTLAGKPAAGTLQWIRECPDPMASQVSAQIAKDGSYSVDLGSHGTWYVRRLHSSGGQFFPFIPKTKEHRLDFELPAGILSGRVLDEAGEPVKGARVSLQATEAEYEHGPLGASNEVVTTRKNGSFKFKGLTRGAYIVGAVHKNLGVASSVIVPLAGEGPSQEITFTLSGGYRIHGTVKGPEGFPANHSALWIYDQAGRLLNPITVLGTGASGTFSTHPLPPGRYSLLAQSGLAVAQALDVLLEEADLNGVELPLEPGAVLTVESHVNGEPHRALVSASDTTGRLLTGLRYNRDPWQWRRHPFDSIRKRLGPLPPGTYTVSSHVPNVGTVTDTVTVVGAEEMNITLRHRP